MIALGVVLVSALLLGGCVLVLANLDLGLEGLGNIDLDLFGDECDEDERAGNPLLAAAARGDSREVARRLDAGVDPDAGSGGETALTCAASARRVEVVRLLLERGAHPSNAALRTAIGARDTGLGLPGLRVPAADPARDEIVRLLLEHGAHPDGGANGPSPLLFAAWSGQASVVDLLLAHGAGVNHGGRVPSLYVSAAQVAVPGGWVTTVTTTVALPTPRGDSVANVPPLVGAVWSGHVEIATRLLDAGADPNLAADEAFSPIFAAAVRGDRAMVDLLLARGASPTPTVRAGVMAPADAARAAGHTDIADLLAGAADSAA